MLNILGPVKQVLDNLLIQACAVVSIAARGLPVGCAPQVAIGQAVFGGRVGEPVANPDHVSRGEVVAEAIPLL